MSKKTDPSSSPKVQATAKLTEDAKQALLDRLDQLWSHHEADGLLVRHQMGTELNAKLGPPTQRQAYGRAAVREAAERLHVHVSELSRMRNLAHRFESVDQLQAKHPEVRSWTAFKTLLPELVAKEAPEGKRAAQSV